MKVIKCINFTFPCSHPGWRQLTGWQWCVCVLPGRAGAPLSIMYVDIVPALARVALLWLYCGYTGTPSSDLSPSRLDTFLPHQRTRS